jgi:hypothetical protein
LLTGIGRGIRVGVLVVVAIAILANSAVGQAVPYGDSQGPKRATYPSRCPPSQVECLLLGMDCIDYDASGWCLTTCGVICGLACIPGSWFWGISCSLGCAYICWEGCKYCEQYEYYWYCYCPGDPIPTSTNTIPARAGS